MSQAQALAFCDQLSLNSSMAENTPKDPNAVAPNTKAVAIKREAPDLAPKITAKGHGFNAEKILDIAFAEGVKVRQDKDLTELLDAFEVDCPVPLEALHVVSLILERAYAENTKMASSRTETNTDSVETSHTLIPESALHGAEQNKREEPNS